MFQMFKFLAYLGFKTDYYICFVFIRWFTKFFDYFIISNDVMNQVFHMFKLFCFIRLFIKVKSSIYFVSSRFGGGGREYFGYYVSISDVLNGYLWILHGCSGIILVDIWGIFYEYFRDISPIFKGYLRDILRQFWEYFWNILRVTLQIF